MTTNVIAITNAKIEYAIRICFPKVWYILTPKIIPTSEIMRFVITTNANKKIKILTAIMPLLILLQPNNIKLRKELNHLIRVIVTNKLLVDKLLQPNFLNFRLGKSLSKILPHFSPIVEPLAQKSVDLQGLFDKDYEG